MFIQSYKNSHTEVRLVVKLFILVSSLLKAQWGLGFFGWGFFGGEGGGGFILK